MTPEEDSDMLEADTVPQTLAEVSVMTPIEEAHVFEDYIDDDGDEDNDEEEFYVEEIVVNEEDPLDPRPYGDVLLLVYHAIFQ